MDLAVSLALEIVELEYKRRSLVNQFLKNDNMSYDRIKEIDSQLLILKQNNKYSWEKN